jgi:hypothetical protein
MSKPAKPSSKKVGDAVLVVSIPVSCESAWNKDPVFGVIGIQTGPRG